MGKVKYLGEIIEFVRKSLIFTTRDINMITKNPQYTYLLLNRLVKRGSIKRLTKGFYTIHEDPVLLVYCFKPAYLGLQEALSLLNIWEQETNLIIITTRKVRRGLREVFGQNVVIRRIRPKYFFGFDYIKYDEFLIPVSDIEKTLIDFFYFKQPLDRRYLRIMKKKINKKRFIRYLKKYPEKFRKKFLSRNSNL